jgi:hypothetical protein
MIFYFKFFLDPRILITKNNFYFNIKLFLLSQKLYYRPAIQPLRYTTTKLTTTPTPTNGRGISALPACFRIKAGVWLGNLPTALERATISTGTYRQKVLVGKRR